jgi:hypothetical protein
MGITHPKYKAAVVQAAPVWIDLEGTVTKTIRYIEEAAKEGAKRQERRQFFADHRLTVDNCALTMA